jgi:ABC-type transporter MlaC component
MSDASSGHTAALKAIGDTLVLEIERAVRTPKLGDVPVALHEAMAPQVDYPWITKYVVGVQWRLADDDQRLALARETRRLLMLTFASALLPVRDGKIALKSLRIEPNQKNASLQMELTRPHAPGLGIGWMLAQAPDDWMIRDLVVDGMSFLQANRRLYDAAIQAGGIDGLIRRLAEEIREAGARF